MALCGVDVPCFTQPMHVSRNGLDLEDEEPIEINYDSADLTMLYQAIEDKAFMAAIDFLESGKPEVYDECRTWITRYEKENPKKIRWSQLPLHAAIVFGGPTKLVQLLVEIYPKGVRCTDDRVMLPIHLAFRKCSNDAILHCLLTKFPASINAKDSRGRTPLQVQPSQKAAIISLFEENAKVRARKALTDEKVSAVQERLATADLLNSELQNKNELLDEQNKALKEQVEALETELTDLKDGTTDQSAIRKTPSLSILSVRSTDRKSAADKRAAALAGKDDATDKEVVVESKKKTPLIRMIFRGFRGRKRKTAASDSKTAPVVTEPLNETTKEDKEATATIAGSEDEQDKSTNPASDDDADVIIETVVETAASEQAPTEQAPPVVEPIAQ